MVQILVLAGYVLMFKETKKHHYVYICISLSIILLGIIVLSFYMGRFTKVNMSKIPLILIDRVIPITPQSWTSIEERVIISLRLPRIIAAIIIGASLSISGVSFQMLFSNPMASPDTLGVTSSSSFGAVLAIFLSVGAFFTKMLSFAVGCFSVLFVLFVATKLSKGRNMTIYLILIGMVVSAMFSALLSIIKYLADPMLQLPQITYWLMGSFANVTTKDLPYCILFFSIGAIPIFLLRWKMNLLSLSEYEARSMGENVFFLKVITIVSATLLTASSVAMTGGIGWVGLVIPHIARILVGSDSRKLLPVSALLGSSFLLLMDNFARSLSSAEIPISILTSLFGAPIFFILLIKSKERITNEN